jgi:cathepsin C
VKYFAFSKYAKKSKHDFDSLCGETLIGWYNNLETGDRGCYRAVKVDGSVEPTQSLDMISVVQPEFTETKNEQKDFDLDSYLDLPIMAEVAPSDRIHLHKEFSDHDEVVENLNKVPSNIPIP